MASSVWYAFSTNVDATSNGRNTDLHTQSLNPGGIKTNLHRYTPWYMRMLLWCILHEPIYGAYTELFAGLSPEANASKNGAYIVPWGRFGHPLREDLLVAQRTEEGGTGHAAKFWEWSEEQVKPYL